MSLGLFTLNGKQYEVDELLDNAGPAKDVALDELLWLLDKNVWEDHNFVPITPRAVLLCPRQYPYHHKRIMDADLSYPILVYAREDGGIGVADGCHRLCKAFILAHTYISARYVELE